MIALAVVLSAGVLVAAGCQSLLGVSKRDQRLVLTNAAAIERLCGRGAPSARRDRRLRPHLDRLIDVVGRTTGRVFDADPNNDPGIEDEVLPEEQLQYVQGLFTGVENPKQGACSRPLARMAAEALDRLGP